VLSIIVPVFNEEKGLRDFLLELNLELERNKSDIEIIFVNDHSVDTSSIILLDYVNSQKNYKNVDFRIVENPTNLGYGASLKRGIRVAKYKTCAIIDSDTTYAFHELLVLYDELKNSELQMIVGARSGKFYEGNLNKKILRRILRRIVEYMANRSIQDINSGIRVFDRELAIRNLRLLSDRFSFTTSITLVFMLSGALVDYRPVSYRKRSGGSKVKLFSDSIRTLGLILAVSFYFNPLKVLYPVTLALSICALTSLMLGIMASIATLIILGALGIISVLIILTLGLIGHLISLSLNK
jgi:glycosyltransferase involved in cell wall biosynthesis